MNEVCRRRIEDDDLHGHAEVSLQLGFELLRQGAQPTLGRPVEENADVDIASRSGLCSGYAAKQISSDDLGGGRPEERDEALLGKWAVHTVEVTGYECLGRDAR